MLSAEEITEQLDDLSRENVVIYYDSVDFDMTIYYNKLEEKYYLDRLKETFPVGQRITAELCKDNVIIRRYDDTGFDIKSPSMFIESGCELYECIYHLKENKWNCSVINNWLNERNNFTLK